MVEVEIRGKKFPLCLTVAALDKVNEKCGGLGKLSDFMKGYGDSAKAAYNIAWMLGLMISEGEENRFITARLEGAQAVRKEVPDSAAICHFMTPGKLRQYRAAVYEAVNESLKQEIEADYPKNAENAERE